MHWIPAQARERVLGIQQTIMMGLEDATAIRELQRILLRLCRKDKFIGQASNYHVISDCVHAAGKELIKIYLRWK